MSCVCPRFYAHRTEFRRVPEAEYSKETCFPGAMTLHSSGCAWAAGITGGEYHTRDEHVDARAATDEAMKYDYDTAKARKDRE